MSKNKSNTIKENVFKIFIKEYFFWTGIASIIYFLVVIIYGINENGLKSLRYNDGFVFIVHSLLMASIGVLFIILWNDNYNIKYRILKLSLYVNLVVIPSFLIIFPKIYVSHIYETILGVVVLNLYSMLIIKFYMDKRKKENNEINLINEIIEKNKKQK